MLNHKKQDLLDFKIQVKSNYLFFITLQTNLQYAPTQNYQRTADLIVKAEWYV